jgi:polyhydroxyalkanoate synthase
LGENIAATPSKVVFESDLFQLLQCVPSTERVFRRPLLVIPSWLNKFYVLDLRPENSLIRWWVDQGFTVFVISWANPDAATADRDFDDYLVDGVVAALEAIEKITGVRELNAVGYCLGGTLLACASAFLEARGDRRIVSSTYLTTMLDFSHPGDLEIFIDEEQLNTLQYPTRSEDASKSQGATLACCSQLRANDLVWSFFINSYLLGKGSFPVDILYWNGDFSNVPSTMHGFYLRHMYQRNLLREPGGITLAGQPIDLGTISNPAYFLSAVEDHLAPWKSTYEGARLLSGDVRFVLSGAGHVASVIDSSYHGESCYWSNAQLSEHAEDWFEGAEKHRGGWRSDWFAWIGAYAGEMVPARVPGADGLAVIEDGPGAYVRKRALR